MASAGKQKARVDEDVDDLDDILGEFNAPPLPSNPASPPPTAAATYPTPSKTAVPQTEDDALDADFAEEFARQMEDVLLELGGDTGPPSAPRAESSADEERRRQEAFKKAWEAMLIEGMDGATGATKGAGTGTGGKSGVEDAFQKNIREAMERLKQSDANLQTDAAGGDDELEKLLAQLGDVGTDEEGLGGILEGMMGQLMSREVLYEPLKELHDKFPGYLKANDGKLNTEEKTRYAAQQKCVTQIVAIFEDPVYNDENTEKGAEIVALMSEMQTHGTPPAELMGPLPPGLSLGADGMPKLPEDCVIA